MKLEAEAKLRVGLADCTRNHVIIVEGVRQVGKS